MPMGPIVYIMPPTSPWPRKVAQQSMVLLKNDNNVLPLNKANYPSMMMLGPNAAAFDADGRQLSWREQ